MRSNPCTIGLFISGSNKNLEQDAGRPRYTVQRASLKVIVAVAWKLMKEALQGKDWAQKGQLSKAELYEEAKD